MGADISIQDRHASHEVVIIGASGGLGAALVTHYASLAKVQTLHVTARTPSAVTATTPLTVQYHSVDILDESSLCALASQVVAPDLVRVATGLLSNGKDLRPERSLKQQSAHNFERIFATNTIGPALIAKHLLPKMPRERRAVFAALSKPSSHTVPANQMFTPKRSAQYLARVIDGLTPDDSGQVLDWAGEKVPA